jgi:hypothetical protein
MARVQDMSNDELSAAWAAGLASVKSRNKGARQQAYGLEVAIRLAEASDPVFTAARNALMAATDPRGELRLIEKFSPELLVPPTPRVTELLAEVASYEALEAAYFAALAANAQLTALHVQRSAVFEKLSKRDDSNPVEVAARDANHELVRRGLKQKRVR